MPPTSSSKSAAARAIAAPTAAGERPRRKGYRPYRNRAIVYTLLGTGMRRAAIRNLNLAAVDFDRRLVTVTEKGGAQQTYHISRAALAAISDYLTHERPGDAAGTRSPALFLAAASHGKGDARLSVRSLNRHLDRHRQDRRGQRQNAARGPPRHGQTDHAEHRQRRRRPTPTRPQATPATPSNTPDPPSAKWKRRSTRSNRFKST